MDAAGERDRKMLDAVSVLLADLLVQSMVTDAWEATRHKVASLFGRGQPAPAIERRLDATHERLAGATLANLQQVQAEEAAVWRVRFEDLLADHPDAVAELTALANEIEGSLPASIAIEQYNSRVQAWIADRWPADSACPMCQTASGWELVEMANLRIREDLPGAPLGRELPVVPLTCKRCSYVVLLGAVRMGLLEGTPYQASASGILR